MFALICINICIINNNVQMCALICIHICIMGLVIVKDYVYVFHSYGGYIWHM